MIRTPFIPKVKLAELIKRALNNKTRTVQATFTEKQTIYIWKYLRRTDVWVRANKTTYFNKNNTLKLTFLNNRQIKLEVRNG